jgi:glycosyltransferase involved in cell wall biosynthesis
MTTSPRVVVLTTPVWMHGDGVGHDVEGMARALLVAGYRVFVYAPYFCASVYEAWRAEEGTVRRLLADPDTTLIHHHSIGCAETESLLRDARSRVRIMRYHNVTPPEFFEGYDDKWVSDCANGRVATVKVVAMCTHFSVPSLYNARDLIHAGADADLILYLPYFHKLTDFDRVAPDADVLQMLRSDSRLHVLFLGRRVTNKGHLHLIRTVGHYVRLYDRQIVLHLVGAADPSLARYDKEIRATIAELGVQDNVVLYDKMSFAGICAFYKGVDVFLCMSEHEGFCIPIIEAEYCGLPVIAHYRRGVPEALGPTQRWFTSLDYATYAAALNELRVDPALAERTGADAARSVRERFDIEAIRGRFLNWFGVVAGGSREPEAADGQRARVAFVVQRYGADVAGGAETFARMYAERIAARYDVTVITTNSRTLDWDAQLPLATPAGAQSAANIPTVVRFPPARPRDWAEWSRANEAAENGELSFADWLVVHGPDTPDMAAYLQRNVEEFDIVVNWTYLFATARYASELGGLLPTICVPFFHDEPWLYLPGHAQVASRFDAYVFQTDAERALAEQVGGLDDKPQIVLGAGIEEDAVRALYDAPTTAPLDVPYIIFVGRIETAKSVPELVSMFARFKAFNPGPLKLVLVGRVHGCELPDDADIVMPGFLSETDKLRYVKHALCLVNPSKLESFSLVLLESWALGRPVMVSSRCPATTSQVARSGGGLAYGNFRDFEWALLHLMQHPEAADELGRNGLQYYTDNYLWSNIIPRFCDFLDSAMAEWQVLDVASDAPVIEDGGPQSGLAGLSPGPVAL